MEIDKMMPIKIVQKPIIALRAALSGIPITDKRGNQWAFSEDMRVFGIIWAEGLVSPLTDISLAQFVAMTADLDDEQFQEFIFVLGQ
jgi:hypothetical protein